MKILILGGSGMLGHRLWLRLRHEFEVWVTLRRDGTPYVARGLFADGRVCPGVEAERWETVEAALTRVRPDVVLNCIGIIKQLDLAKDAVASITINSLLPHLLLRWCREHHASLIHFSTDCVFSGSKGGYREADLPDVADLYGRSKFLGEVTEPPGLTLRTSIIGPELDSARSLFDWFRSQTGGKVKGYRRAIYSGFPTTEMAEIVARLLRHHLMLNGVYHVASAPISKFELLQLIRDKCGLNIEVTADDALNCDRSLNSDRFRAATGYVAPAWPAMLDSLIRQL